MSSTLSFGKEWITVVNRALSALSKPHMDSLEDESDPNVLYLVTVQLPEAVLHVLNEHQWRALKKTAELSRSSANGQFALPSDMISIDSENSDSGWLHLGNSLYVADLNVKILNITYVYCPTTPDAIPHNILTLISKYLAFLLAFPLTGSESQQSLAYQEYSKDLVIAKRADGADEPCEPVTRLWGDCR